MLMMQMQVQSTHGAHGGWGVGVTSCLMAEPVLLVHVGTEFSQKETEFQ